MAFTIPVGIAAITILYGLLYRFSPLNAKHSAFIVSLLGMVVYFPYALINWPGADILVMNVTSYFMTAYILGIIFSHRDAKRRGEGNGKWFQWEPALIVGFFIFILVVDGIFVTVSMEGIPNALEGSLMKGGGSHPVNTNFPGLVHNNYYKKESRFNQYLREVEAIRQLGWQIRKGWLDHTPASGEEGVFQVVIEDREGKRVSGVTLHGRFMRPSDSRKDVLFAMKEVSPGQFQARVRLPDPGEWNLSLQLEQDTLKYNLRASTTLASSN